LTVVPEAPLEQTEHGLSAAGAGWFVLNMSAGSTGGWDSRRASEARQWHFVHCPAGTQHVIVGAGDRPCVVSGVGARENHTAIGPDGRLNGREDWGAYTVDEAALRHGAGVEKETKDADEAYARIRARFPDPQPMRYRDGWLPDS
jgi:hypothetical protein